MMNRKVAAGAVTLALTAAALAPAAFGGPSGAATPRTAAAAPSLFGSAPAADARLAPNRSVDPRVTRARYISFRADLLPSKAADQKLSLPFFADAHLTATVQRIDRQPLLTSWSGTIGHDNGTFVATRSGHTWSVLASTPQGVYTMRTLPNGLYQVEQNNPPDNTLGDDEVFGSGYGAKLSPMASKVATASESARGHHHKKKIKGGDDGSIEDILVVYTPAAAAAYGGVPGIQAEAAKNIGYTNAAYAASGVGTVARLVGVLPVSGPEYDGNQDADLTHLAKQNDGIFDETKTYIKQTHADSTILLEQPYTDGASCGLSFSHHNQPADLSFSVVATGSCTDGYTSFPHELGHQQGAEHDLWTLQNDPLGHGPLDAQYPFGYGYVSPDLKFNTIMSYSAECVHYTGYSCQYRLFNFSNPAVFFQGEPTGTVDRNNVALLITKTRFRMAAHEQSQLYPTRVHISPKPRVGQKVHAAFKKWLNGRVHYHYQWYVNGVPAKHGKHSSFKIKGKYKHAALSVAVIGTKRYYAPVSAPSKARKIKGRAKHHGHHHHRAGTLDSTVNSTVAFTTQAPFLTRLLSS